MSVTLRYSSDLATSDPQHNPVLIVGQVKNLAKISYDQVKRKLEPRVTEETYTAAVGGLHPSPTDSCPLWLNNATVAALPTKCSRHNTPSRSHALTKVVKSCFSGGDEYVVIVCEKSDVFASGCAIARALPLFNSKSSNSNSKRSVTVEFLLVGSDGDLSLSDSDVECLNVVASAIRLTARIVDAPCADMHTDAFLDEVRKVGTELNIIPTIIQGEALREKGLGGIYGVGKAAIHEPALAVLSHTPEGATKSIAWVGKGIVYDTGGLCIKAKTSMLGMKRDCGGAAAMLGAFYAAVKLGFTENLHCVLCLAENAVGPNAVRPDDILKLYSGRTVEINNTDAEGRLVLGDGVAYADKDLKAGIIVDMATLTGAQGVATGRYHAGVVTNSEDWEGVVVKAGQNSGDLAHPLPYSPELHFSEFASALADMKNSVADRSNCQVSCAGLFIASHLGFDYPGVWIHVDMASPAHSYRHMKCRVLCCRLGISRHPFNKAYERLTNQRIKRYLQFISYDGERATGYGVALMTTLFGKASKNSLLQYNAPAQSYDGMDGQENSAKKIRLN